MTIDVLFEPPSGWGMRGDPLLWEDIRLAFEREGVPSTLRAFEDQLHRYFKDFTGHKIRRGEDYFVPKYDVGGMTRGRVCCDFWLDRGIPLLLARFGELSST